MKPAGFKNMAALVAEMRSAVGHPAARIEYRTLKRCEASSVYNPNGGEIIIYIGRGRCGRIRAVTHELAHMILDARMDGLGMDIEEPMIVGLEEALVKRITKSDRQLRWWLDAIRAKLPESHKDSG